jgi:hypothetical protein
MIDNIKDVIYNKVKGGYMKKNIWAVFCVLGWLFILNAVFGRYIVLPGYFESLNNAGNNIPENVPIYKIIRYLVWAFSFKLGVYFFVIGVLLKKRMENKNIILFSIIGLLYIGFAYMEIPIKSSLFFGIFGGIITILSFILFWILPKENISKNNINEYIGYFFIINGIYNLCPLMGVKCFALYPEKMIEYNLQDTAFSFADHIMIEFALGFIFLIISKAKRIEKRK